MGGSRPAPTLGPADDGKEAVTHGPQPLPLLACGEGEIGFGPGTGPVVFGTVESGGSEPVLPRELVTVTNAHASLFGRIDEKETAQRPEGLASETLLRLLVDNCDGAAGIRQFCRRHQPRQAGAHDDHIRLGLAHRSSWRDAIAYWCIHALTIEASQYPQSQPQARTWKEPASAGSFVLRLYTRRLTSRRRSCRRWLRCRSPAHCPGRCCFPAVPP